MERSLQDTRRGARIVAGKKRGCFLLPDERAEVYLNPMERTLYRLFLAHPEGISAADLSLHRKELYAIYSRESRYDEHSLMLSKVEALCAASKTAFYVTVSRIKRKFVAAVGRWRAETYIIRRNEAGVYSVWGAIPIAQRAGRARYDGEALAARESDSARPPSVVDDGSESFPDACSNWRVSR